MHSKMLRFLLLLDSLLLSRLTIESGIFELK